MGEAALTRKGKMSARYAWQLSELSAVTDAVEKTVWYNSNTNWDEPMNMYTASAVTLNPDGTVNLVLPYYDTRKWNNAGYAFSPSNPKFHSFSGATNVAPGNVFKFASFEAGGTTVTIRGYKLSLGAGTTLGAVISNNPTKYPDNGQSGNKFYKKVVI